VNTKLATLAVTAAIALVAATEYSGAQVAGKVPKVGVLSYLSRGNPPGTLAFFEGLREFGYVEGDNIVIDWRGAEGDATKFPKLAVDLVTTKVDVIVATGDPAIQAARAASTTIPIVMVTPSVASCGLVGCYGARPPQAGRGGASRRSKARCNSPCRRSPQRG
jgi:putative ABC transport system substrate-binding protein